MNKVERFKKLLKLRTIFKQVSQLSWNISALEKRYPFNTLDDEEIAGLFDSYKEYAKDVKKLNDELEDELDGEKHG